MYWKTVLLCFRTWGMDGQNIQEVRELEDRLPEAGTPEGPLAAINSLPTMEAYRPLLSQDVLQARLQITSRGNIQDVNWTLVWQGGRWSWAWEQLELSERDTYQNSCSQESSCSQPSHTHTKTKKKKRWQNRQWTRNNLYKVERDRGRYERFSKPSGGPFTNTSTWPSEQERVSFFQWMLEFTSRMPRQNWREFQKQAFTMACAFTPTDSPQGHQSRPRLSQEASTSSSQAHHGQQYPMNPPARPPAPGAGGFLELLQTQTNEMVSNFFLVILLMLNSRKSFFAQQYVMFANCQ